MAPPRCRSAAALLAAALLAAGGPQDAAATARECHADPTGARQLNTQACTCPNGCAPSCPTHAPRTTSRCFIPGARALLTEPPPVRSGDAATNFCCALSLEACGQHCDALSLAVAGVEAGHVCFCGAALANASAVLPLTACDAKPCPAAPHTEACGGDNVLLSFSSAAMRNKTLPKPPPKLGKLEQKRPVCRVLLVVLGYLGHFYTNLG